MPAALRLSAFATTFAVVKLGAVPVFSGNETRRFKKDIFLIKTPVNRVCLSESAKLLCKSIDYIGVPERLEANHLLRYPAFHSLPSSLKPPLPRESPPPQSYPLSVCQSAGQVPQSMYIGPRAMYTS